MYFFKLYQQGLCTQYYTWPKDYNLINYYYEGISNYKLINYY